jgi:hypothetical protein
MQSNTPKNNGIMLLMFADSDGTTFSIPCPKRPAVVARSIWVNTVNGDDANDGHSPETALATHEEAARRAANDGGWDIHLHEPPLRGEDYADTTSLVIDSMCERLQATLSCMAPFITWTVEKCKGTVNPDGGFVVADVLWVTGTSPGGQWYKSSVQPAMLELGYNAVAAWEIAEAIKQFSGMWEGLVIDVTVKDSEGRTLDSLVLGAPRRIEAKPSVHRIREDGSDV